ncbi:MAG: N-acetylmuramoyl-L-alanine amidase [Prolixibacteraceae bacterium]
MLKYYIKTVFLIILIGIIAENTFSGTVAKQANKQMVVVIDPGHGGKDPGAVNKNVREKDVVLGVGQKLGKYITENFPDVKVIYTRNTDVFIPLIERSRIANKNKADLFISIHANTCGTPGTRGTETFVLGLHRSNENLDVAKKENSVILLEDDYKKTYQGFDPNSSESYIMFELVQDIYMDQSLSFADDIQRQLRSSSSSPNRGVKQAGFLVLRESSMPSVLIETGFISNQNEANYLKSDEGQRNIALSIFDAFRKFKNKANGTNNDIPARQVALSKPDNSLNEKVIDPIPDSVSKQQADEPARSESSKVATERSESKSNSEPKSEPEAVNRSAKNDTFYSIQIAASTTSMEPLASNFKGLKDVRREKSDKYYRYYIGKSASVDEIMPILEKVKLKYSEAFIVSFVDGKRIIYKPN